MKKWEVSRRACLRGAGVMLGLPTLEAMLPGMKRARAAGGTPKRLVFFVFDGGTPDTSQVGLAEGAHNAFWPSTSGTDFETTPILEPLADLKKDILLIRNLNNVPGTPDHAGQSCSLLSGALSKIDGTGDVISEAGISADRFAANRLKQFTPGLPNLFLSNPIHPEHSNYLVSWTGPRSRIYPKIQPSEAFKEVFGDNTISPAELKKRVAFKKSVLHHVKAQADQLKQRLGTADQQALEKYFDSISSLEERLAATGMNDRCAMPPAAPKDTPVTDESDPTKTYEENFYHRNQVDMPSHLQHMADIVTLAFQCDRTRVVTVQAYSGSMKFKWLGAPYDQYTDYHGDMEHGQESVKDNHPQRLQGYIKGVSSIIAQFGYLVRKLKETPEGDGSGSLLDNSILVCTSEMSYGNGHTNINLPVIVAGRGGGAVQTGRYMSASNGSPIANLWVSMLQGAGIDVSTFGNSTGALPLA